ncbi:hypothetical protein [Streptomyces sp. SLBN-115]|uniref:hypothetical protein n=1 Tax=Streptomyces sp. SLBN-115 TaxID=2768453 RepID=UPI0011757F2D|nr:hypothetical protein [Streptomyces sp. SLBN-115]TQJ47350.1 secreted repeat protein with Y-X4-D motif [Streptomyces sp. SLBN-115]
MILNSTTTHGPFTRAALTALVLCGLSLATGCGKTVSVGSSSDTPASVPSRQESSAPPAGQRSAPPPAAGNTGLQVVDSTAADNGLKGTGGTVTGKAAQEAPPRWVQLAAVQSPALGTHLININQATLYRFDKDPAEPSKSTCVGECATTWPPVTIEEGGNVYLAGVEEKQVGAIRRDDGSVQLTVGGRPVYRYSGDSRAGDANGQGLGGTWFAVGPTGRRSVLP